MIPIDKTKAGFSRIEHVDILHNFKITLILSVHNVQYYARFRLMLMRKLHWFRLEDSMLQNTLKCYCLHVNAEIVERISNICCLIEHFNLVNNKTNFPHVLEEGRG